MNQYVKQLAVQESHVQTSLSIQRVGNISEPFHKIDCISAIQARNKFRFVAYEVRLHLILE